MGKRRLTEDEVRAIRKAAASCKTCGCVPSYSTLARRYGISRVSIHHVVKRHSYKEVD